jgi:hypothetical protein
MKKVLIREVLIYSTLLILLALLMHPDMIQDPSQRFSLLQSRGNYLHLFIYTTIVFLIVYVFRYVTKKIVSIVAKLRNR